MVSVGMSKLNYTNSIFVDPGVKVNEAYYRDVMLFPGLRLQRKIDDTAERSTDNLAVKEKWTV